MDTALATDTLGAATLETWLRRASANLAALWQHPARAMGQRRAIWADVWAADPGSANFFPNSATLLRPLSESAAPELAARLDSFYGAGQGGPYILWSGWPTPDLTAHGFTLGGQPPLMVRPATPAPVPTPPGLRVVEVADAATLADFERVMVEGYPVPELQPFMAGSMFDTRVLGDRLRLWVGYADDAPVTTAAAYVSDDCVGVHCVATMPAARGRGYGAALTDGAARARPERPALLQASDLGRPVYERLGFRTISRFSLWLKPRPGVG